MYSLKNNVALLFVFLMTLCAVAQPSVNTDSIARINQEKIAKAFHEKLNAFRKQQRCKPLEWNDTLALAGHNHNKWMTENDLLSHTENPKKNINFTGKTPSERADYVGKRKNGWNCGENCLYFTAFVPEGKEISDLHAQSLAEQALQQWKDSREHKANMLYNYKNHGTAFFIFGPQVWATDVFSD